MKKFFVFSMAAYGFLSIHILEESLRLGLEKAEVGALLPLILFPLGLTGIYLAKKWGFWITWLTAVLIAILPALSHFIPSSESFIGKIYQFWQGAVGIGSVAAVLGISLSAIASVLLGIKLFPKRKQALNSGDSGISRD